MNSNRSADPVDRRRRMVSTQIEARGIRDPRVLTAMRRVPRQFFLPAECAGDAYADCPLPIGNGQTMSQPYIVALMTEMLGLGTGSRVLEIGTGSGYQAAILSEIVREVFTVEVRPSLFETARRCLDTLGANNIRFRQANGWDGWPEFAPFDRIIVTACAGRVPLRLVEQLSPAGVMVIPLARGGSDQVLCRVNRTESLGMDIQDGIPVRFVPMLSNEETEK